MRRRYKPLRSTSLPRAPASRPRRYASILGRLALAVGGVLAGVCAAELGLALAERGLPPERRFEIPAAWRARRLSDQAYLWHGRLHRYNSLGFRGGEWGPKRAGVFRIAVLGDSITYGYGVGEEQAYPALIERALGARYRVEVLNLGYAGANSPDILYLADRFLPRLSPDLVLYGVCLNDYLPSMTPQYRRVGPWRWSEAAPARTRVGAILSAGLHGLLARLGLEQDFVHDALDASTRYAARFERDAADLNRAARARGAPPVVAMVVSQIPGRSDALELTRRTETILGRAGMTVVPAETYLERWAGRPPLTVSRWEGHPSAEAHAAFADAFVRAIEGTPAIARRLEPFLRR